MSCTLKILSTAGRGNNSLFQDRNEEGIPVKWIEKIKNSLANLAPEFTMGRMLRDYRNKYYDRLYERSTVIQQDDFEAARSLTAWKRTMMQEWKNIKLPPPKSMILPIVLSRLEGTDFKNIR